MKYALALFLLVSAIAQADTPLAQVSCVNYVCFDPAPDVSYVGTDSTYSTAVANVDGVLYTGPTTSSSNGTITAELHSADGRTVILTASFRRWTTVVNSGRLHKTQVHLELLGGSIS